MTFRRPVCGGVHSNHSYISNSESNVKISSCPMRRVARQFADRFRTRILRMVFCPVKRLGSLPFLRPLACVIMCFSSVQSVCHSRRLWATKAHHHSRRFRAFHQLLWPNRGFKHMVSRHRCCALPCWVCFCYTPPFSPQVGVGLGICHLEILKQNRCKVLKACVDRRPTAPTLRAMDTQWARIYDA